MENTKKEKQYVIHGVSCSPIQDLLVKFLTEKKKTDPTNVYDTRAMMLNEFYAWLLEHCN